MSCLKWLFNPYKKYIWKCITIPVVLIPNTRRTLMISCLQWLSLSDSPLLEKSKIKMKANIWNREREKKRMIKTPPKGYKWMLLNALGLTRRCASFCRTSFSWQQFLNVLHNNENVETTYLCVSSQPGDQVSCHTRMSCWPEAHNAHR